MAKDQTVYTYRAGEKVRLKKRPDEFVVRALPDRLQQLGIPQAEKVSSISSRVKVKKTQLEQMMKKARGLAPAHHAYHVADTDEEFLITDRIFVTFRTSPTAEQLDAFSAKYGLIKREVYSDREFLFQLTDHTGMNPVKLVVKLNEKEIKLIESAEHDLNYREAKFQLAVPTDPAYARQWHLHTRLVNPAFDIRASSRCEEAWQLLGHFGSSEVVVGVTDDGCKLSHLDFDSPRKFAGWGYFQGTRLVTDADIDADPSRMYEDGANHGTACAGVIAGEADAVLTVGAAPGARLFPIKWESEGPFLLLSDSKLLTALNFMADKVDVLSNSWGRTPTSIRIPAVVNRIAELARTGGRRGKGIVFLWAAGNENCPIKHTASVKVPYEDGWEFRDDGSRVWVGVRTARRFDNNLVGIPGVMHVAALASTAQRSHYSNYGTGISVCAPTNNVHAYHRLTVRGLGITTTSGPGSDTTASFGGTSSATPLVAGIAALVISANPELSALEVVSILERTASKDLDFAGYARTPSASYDQNPSWDVSPIPPFDKGDFANIGSPEGSWSPWFGHGRVDALAAVAAARPAAPDPGAVKTFTSAPNRAIPDNDAAGIHDVVHVSEAGRVQELRVSVDIAHPWLGDLQVTLEAPDGTTVVLHSRSGSSQDNLVATYDATTLPLLSLLSGRSITGDWTLRVQDLAAQDVGTLKQWKLEIKAGNDPTLVEDVAGVQIPDADPVGIVRSLVVPDRRLMRELAISLDITHSWIGDLVVTLVPPDHPPILLHNRSGEGADNIVRIWRTRDMPELQALRGQDLGGTWQLKVVDLERRDLGKLNRWSLEIIN